jgi:hypothetical protein
MSSRIQELLAEYTAKIEAELKGQLVSVVAGLDLSGDSAPARRPSPNGRASTNGHRGKGDKRPPEELDALASKFVDYVAKHPGMRIEQVNKELGTSTKDLALPIRKLIAEKKIKTTGKKRATTYTVTGAKRAK